MGNDTIYFTAEGFAFAIDPLSHLHRRNSIGQYELTRSASDYAIAERYFSQFNNNTYTPLPNGMTMITPGAPAIFSTTNPVKVYVGIGLAIFVLLMLR